MQTVVESGDKSFEHEKSVEQVCGIKVHKPAVYLVVQTIMLGFQLGNNRPSGNSDGRTGLEARTPLHARGSWLSSFDAVFGNGVMAGHWISGPQTLRRVPMARRERLKRR